MAKRRQRKAAGPFHDCDAGQRLSLGELREQLSQEGKNYDIETGRAGEKLTIPVHVRPVSLDRN